MEIDDSEDNLFNKNEYNVIPIDFDQLVDSPEDLSSLYTYHNMRRDGFGSSSVMLNDTFETPETMPENFPDHDNSGYIQHTITEDEIRMQIRHNDMPENLSHATLTIESCNQKTNEKEYKKFYCDYEGCERKYSTAGNLKTHQKRHKGMIFNCMVMFLCVSFQCLDKCTSPL
ncbi:metal regulatory transcription factor 1 [Nephila pilipes]|uniref:Metal regulatory transcription factor 1 n=1 Tax=Nephila pilipes TaxID=299642 RepID=A0A8X6MAI4_NEPPI|nr:metal regulatory transcription factor 1 [Nephila pilipes]